MERKIPTLSFLSADPVVQVDFVDAKKHRPIIAALRNHPDDAGVQEEALCLLAVLAGSGMFPTKQPEQKQGRKSDHYTAFVLLGICWFHFVLFIF